MLCYDIMLCYVFVKKFFFEILVSEYSEQSKTWRNLIFSLRPDVRACVRVYPIFSVSNPKKLINGLKYQYEILYTSEEITTL